jgi:hypothetical protein
MTDDTNKFDLTEGGPWDDQIDAALAKNAAVEPRAGLEERILAHLRVQGKTSASVVWWPWAGVVAAAILIAALLLWKLERPRDQRIVRHQPSLQQGTQPQVAAPPALPKIEQLAVRASVRRSRRHIARETTEIAVEPKLDQFPSARPLTPEEKMLVEYIERYYDEAVLIARARDEQIQQDRKEEEANSIRQ